MGDPLSGLFSGAAQQEGAERKPPRKAGQLEGLFSAQPPPEPEPGFIGRQIEGLKEHIRTREEDPFGEVAGMVGGAARGALATGRGIAKAAEKVSGAVGRRRPSGVIGRMARGIERVSGRAYESLSERDREFAEAIEDMGPAARGGALFGRLATDLAQIGLTGGAARATGLAAAIPQTGRLGVGGAARGALVSAPVAGLQALGGEESSTASAIAQVAKDKYPNAARILEDIAADPVERGLFEVAIDASLGAGVEGLLGALGKYFGRAAEEIPDVAEAAARPAQPTARAALPRASQIPQPGVAERKALPFPRAIEAPEAPVRGRLERGPIPAAGVPERRALPGWRVREAGPVPARRTLPAIAATTQERLRPVLGREATPDDLERVLQYVESQAKTAAPTPTPFQPRQPGTTGTPTPSVALQAQRAAAEAAARAKAPRAGIRTRLRDLRVQADQLATEGTPQARKAYGQQLREMEKSGQLTAPERRKLESALRGRPDSRFAGKETDALIDDYVKTLEDFQTDATKVGEGVNVWVRDDPNIAAVRSGTARTGASMRAAGRNAARAKKLDALADELAARGVSGDDISDRTDEFLERLAIQQEQAPGGAASFVVDELGFINREVLEMLAGGGIGAAVGGATDGKEGAIVGAAAGAGAPKAARVFSRAMRNVLRRQLGPGNIALSNDGHPVAAIRFSDGAIFEGADHQQALEAATDAGRLRLDVNGRLQPVERNELGFIDRDSLPPEEFQEGFMSTDGRFMSRAVALQRAREAGQFKRKPTARTVTLLAQDVLGPVVREGDEVGAIRVAPRGGDVGGIRPDFNVEETVQLLLRPESPEQLLELISRYMAVTNRIRNKEKRSLEAAVLSKTVGAPEEDTVVRAVLALDPSQRATLEENVVRMREQLRADRVPGNEGLSPRAAENLEAMRRRRGMEIVTDDTGVALREVLDALAGAAVGGAAGGALDGPEGFVAGSIAGALGPTMLRRWGSLNERGMLDLANGGSVAQRYAKAKTIREIPVSEQAVAGISAMHEIRGRASLRKFTEKVVAKLGDVVRPHARKLFDRAQRDYDKFLSQSAEHNIAQLNHLDERFNEGMFGADWYANTHAAIRRMFGNDTDADMFVDFLAVTSMNTEVGGNVTKALKAFRQWKTGRPFEGIGPQTMHRKLEAAARGEPIGSRDRGNLMARKLANFQAALKGDPDAVVVDLWILRVFGFGNRGRPTARQYDFIEDAIRQAAAERGVEPRQYQAALWVAERQRQLANPDQRPFEEILQSRIDDAGGLTKLLEERGYAISEVLQALTGAGVGAVAGGVAGGEEGALVGAAAGAALPSVARSLARRAGRAGAQAATDAELRQVAGQKTRVQRGPKGRPKARGTFERGTGAVQFDRFGLAEPGQKRLDAEVERLVRQGYQRKRVTHDETRAVAEELNVLDIGNAVFRGDVDSVVLTGMKNVYKQNDELLSRGYKRLRDIESGAATDKSARELIDEKQSILQSIEDVENENRALLRSFVREASEAGRTLNALKIAPTGTMDPIAWHMKASRVAGRDLLDEERLAISTFLEKGDRRGAMKYIRDNLNPEVSALSLEGINILRRAGFLTGLRTQGRNLLSNASEAAMRVVDDKAAAIMDRIAMNVVSHATAGALKQRTRASISIAKRIRAGRDGARKAFGTKARGYRDGTIYRTMKGLDVDEGWQRKVELLRQVNMKNRFLDGYQKFIFRLQGAADQPFRQLGIYSSLIEQAELAVKRTQPSLKGKAFDDAVDAILRDPPDAMVLTAAADGLEATFQNPTAISRAFGSLQQTLRNMEIQGSHLAKTGRFLLNFVVPFKNTPGAVLVRLIERTPVGMVSAVADLIKLERTILKTGMDAEAILAMQRRIATRAGRSATGSLAILIGAYWASKGIMSGRWPDDQDEASRWMQQDKPEDAILINGRWRRVAGVSPIGNLLALGAQFYLDASKEDYQPSGDIDPIESAKDLGYFDRAGQLVEVAGKQGLSAMVTFKEQSFMRGTAELLEALETRSGGEAKRERFLRATAGSFVPILVRDAARILDPVHRDPGGIWEGVKANIPVMSVDVPYRMDEFGRPKVTQPTTRERAQALVDPFLSTTPRETRDPILQRLNEVGAVVPRRSKQQGESDEAYRLRRAQEGEWELAALDQLLFTPQYDRLTADDKRAVAERLIANVRRQMSQRGEVNPGREVQRAFQQITQPRRPR